MRLILNDLNTSLIKDFRITYQFPELHGSLEPDILFRFRDYKSPVDAGQEIFLQFFK